MRFLAPALLAACIATGASAQQQPPAGVTVAGLDRGLTNLGLMAGHAIQCLPDAEKPAAERALLAFNSILIAEMGANAAFRFSSAYGAGSSHEPDRQFCERSLADWRKLVQDHNLNR